MDLPSWFSPACFALGFGVGGAFILIGSILIGRSRIAAGKKEAERIVADAKVTYEQTVKSAQLDGRAERDRLLRSFTRRRWRSVRS